MSYVHADIMFDGIATESAAAYHVICWLCMSLLYILFLKAVEQEMRGATSKVSVDWFTKGGD